MMSLMLSPRPWRLPLMGRLAKRWSRGWLPYRPPSLQSSIPSQSLKTSWKTAKCWRKRLIGLRRRRPERTSLAPERRLPTLKWLTRKNLVIQSPLACIWRLTPRTTLRWPQVGISFPQRKRTSSWVKHPNLRITAPGARPPWSQEG